MKSIIFEITMSSGLLYLYYAVFLRNKPFHTFNRAYLIMAAVIPIFIPFIHIPIKQNIFHLFSGDKSSFGGFSITNSASELAPVQEHGIGHFVAVSGWLIYILIALFLLFRIVVTFIRVAKLLSTHETEKRGDILIVKTKEKDAPFSFYKWLFWNNNIDIDSALGMQILKHETVHIRQYHSVDIALTEMLHAIFWINPFFWAIKKELRTVHEFLADNAISENADKVVFAKLLIDNAMNTQNSMVHRFFGNSVLRRISMISKADKQKYNISGRLFCLLLSICTVLIFSFTTNKQGIALQTLSNANKEPGKNNPEIESDLLRFNVKKETNASSVINNKHSLIVSDKVVPQTNVTKKDDELNILNYRDNTIANNISIPEGNIIPDFVFTRTLETQVIINAGKNQTTFFPSRLYNELVLIFNKNKDTPLAGDWKLHILLLDENEAIAKEENIKPKWITNFETVTINFNNLPKGTYQLQVNSSDNMFNSSCKVVKDYE